jgi:hypothetical protein
MRKWSQRLVELTSEDTPQEEALSVLRREGASAIETIMALCDARGMSLAEAKEAFSKSGVWAEVNANAAALHEALERFAREAPRDK